MKKTTKVLYSRTSECPRTGNYSPANCSGYGTKWRVSCIVERGHFQIIGEPVLLSANWDIDERKLEKQEEYFNWT